MADFTTGDVLRLAPSNAITFDGTNRDAVDAAHPFTDELHPGDVVWSVHDPAGIGDHLCVVRVGRKAGVLRPATPATGGVSRSFGGEYEGAVTIENDRIVLQTAEGARVDMVTAQKIA